jgi:hypothetical protein
MRANEREQNVVAKQQLHHDGRAAEERHVDRADLLRIASQLFVGRDHAHHGDHRTDQAADQEAEQGDNARILHTVQQQLIPLIDHEIIIEEAPLFGKVEAIGNGQGKENAKNYIESDENLLKEIEEKIKAQSDKIDLASGDAYSLEDDDDELAEGDFEIDGVDDDEGGDMDLRLLDVSADD